MISRRRILSRSRDELLNQQTGYPDNYNPYEEEEDVWYSKDKLLKVGVFSFSFFLLLATLVARFSQISPEE